MSLRGYLFSVSVKSEQSQTQAASSSEPEPLSDEPELKYSSVTSAVESLGGKISNTVHKRVTFVIASKRALLKETQRVRKAVKLSIPILDADAVSRACLTGTIKSVKDLDTFVVEFNSQRVAPKQGKCGGYL
jgi:hypothetical protein